MTVDEAVADIGDIVSGREYTTGFLIKQQITQKILRASNDSWSVEFKVGGSIKTSKPIGGGGVDYDAQIDSVDAAVKALDESNTEAHNALLEKDIKLQEQINVLSDNIGDTKVLVKTLPAGKAEIINKSIYEQAILFICRSGDLSICTIDQWNKIHNDGILVDIVATNSGAMSESEITITNKKTVALIVIGLIVSA